MSHARTTALRWSAAAAVLAAAGALAGGNALAGPPAPGEPGQVPAVSVPAGPLTGVCPEPLRLLAGNVAGTDAQFSPASRSASAVASAVVVAAPGSPLPRTTFTGTDVDSILAGGTAQAAPPSGTRGAAVLREQPVSGPAVLVAEPSGSLPASASAVMAFTASDGDLAGLAASNCLVPGSEAWLLGARTTVGATAVLRLTNPGTTASTVDLELHGAEGRLEALGSRGIVVAPGETESLVLGGLAANQAHLAVRVVSAGGPVSAVIQQNLLRGLTPGGIELIQPTVSAAPAQMVPGVVIGDEGLARSLAKQKGYESAVPELLVAVPGSSDAAVTVRAFGESGEVPLPGGGSFTVGAGRAAALPLGGLPAGTYALSVTSDTAVTASAVLHRGTKAKEPVDLAVAAAGARLGSEQLAAIPRGGASRFSFTVPEGSAEIRLQGVGADGVLQPEKILRPAPGSTQTVAAAEVGRDLAGILISSSGDPAYGAQVLTADKGAGLSVVPLPPAAAGERKVPVGVGY